MSTNDGGPAYPVTQWNNDTESYQVMGGMSLRDHFAGLAMAALVTASQDCRMPNDVSFAAYNFADAMMAAREQRT